MEIKLSATAPALQPAAVMARPRAAVPQAAAPACAGTRLGVCRASGLPSLPAGRPLRQRKSASILAKAGGKGKSSVTVAEPELANKQPAGQDYATTVGERRFKTVITLAAVGAVLAVGAAAGGIWIDSFSTEPCYLTPEGCREIPTLIKVPLVAAHMFTFFLIPGTMWVFYTRSNALKEKGAQDPFTSMVGLSYLMVAIAGEIGWHVTQNWFYVEDYSILNFFFYFFLILGTALWAIGIKEDDTSSKKDEIVDYTLLASPVLAGIFYLLGASVLHTKVPIYMLLSFEYAVLTYRFWNLLKSPKVFLFPFFSVGVNLTFIALLNANKDSPIYNPLYHILHDAAGTLLGVAIISYLMYQELPANAQGPRLK